MHQPVACLRLCGSHQIHGDLRCEGFVAVAHNSGYTGKRGQLFRGALRIAAGDHDLCGGIEPVGAADKGARGAVGLGGDAARVDYHQAGF